jgi:hypothetical protein
MCASTAPITVTRVSATSEIRGVGFAVRWSTANGMAGGRSRKAHHGPPAPPNERTLRDGCAGCHTGIAATAPRTPRGRTVKR